MTGFKIDWKLSKINDIFVSLGIFGVLLILLVEGVIGGFLWQYSINSWLDFAGKSQAVLLWHGIIISFMPYFNKVTLTFATITWIAMLFLV